MEYEVTAHTDSGVVGANVDFEIRRTFHNDSGGAITVEEVALYAKTVNSVLAFKYVCLARDLNTQIVANNETLSVKYTLRTTV